MPNEKKNASDREERNEVENSRINFLYREISKTIYKEFAEHNVSLGECKEVLARTVQGLDYIKPWHKVCNKD